MGYAGFLRGAFPDLNPAVDDLLLLESHQVAQLAHRVPDRELAAVLHAHPQLRSHLTTRYPPIAELLTRLLADQPPVDDSRLRACEEAVVWEIADWIVYQRAPEAYDAAELVDYDLGAVTEIVGLEGKVVIDAGAGTGQVAFSVARSALNVFAVEPVSTLRRYMRDKAVGLRLNNVFVLDGFLDEVPLPDDSADILITLQAIGWSLDEELLEIERVVKPGGTALHLFGAAAGASSDNPLVDALESAGYRSDHFTEKGLFIQRCWTRITA